MQNNYNMVDFIKHQMEHEKRKKEELLNSNFFKILEIENKIESQKIIDFLKERTSEDIENIIKFVINKKSVQKYNF